MVGAPGTEGTVVVVVVGVVVVVVGVVVVEVGGSKSAVSSAPSSAKYVDWPGWSAGEKLTVPLKKFPLIAEKLVFGPSYPVVPYVHPALPVSLSTREVAGACVKPPPPV